MWNVVRKMQRRTWVPRRKYGRLGVTGGFALAALVVILVAAWILDWRGASAADQKLARAALAADEDPVQLIAHAARASRIVFLSDIHNSAAVKQLAARAIARIATTSGLDAIVLEIGSDQQPYIDQYLDHAPEDASVLLSRTRALGHPGAATRAYLELYRTIWQINQRLGPDQRIRVIAADLPGWPPAAPSPGELARLMDEREAHMESVISKEILGTFPESRVFVFMTGFHVLKSGAVALQTGGSSTVEVTPLAARLARSSDEVFSFLVDAPALGTTGRQAVPYVGTRVASVLEQTGTRKRSALTITSDFDHLRQPIIETKTPGTEFNIVPRDYRLRAVADAYIYLGS